MKTDLLARKSYIGFGALNKFQKLAYHANRSGLKRTISLVARNLLWSVAEWKERKFDSDRNIITVGEESISLIGASTPNQELSEDYVPTPVSVVKRSIESIDDQLSDFIFIDVGSEKGRVLFKAAEYDFQKVIGVEFSKHLHEICERNINTFQYRNRKCKDFESVFSDILEFDFPKQNLVIFMFNPFGEVMVSKLVDKIRDYYNQKNVKIYIIYYNPKHGSIFLKSGFLRPYPYDQPPLYVSVRPI